MPTEPIKPGRKREEAHSSLPAMERMQRLTHDRMIRREDCTNRGGYTERVLAAVKYEGPTKLAHYHD